MNEDSDVKITLEAFTPLFFFSNWVSLIFMLFATKSTRPLRSNLAMKELDIFGVEPKSYYSNITGQTTYSTSCSQTFLGL